MGLFAEGPIRGGGGVRLVGGEIRYGDSTLWAEVWRNSFSPTLDNEITTRLLSFSIIFFFTEKLSIFCSDMFKWTSVLHRGHGSNTSHLKLRKSSSETVRPVPLSAQPMDLILIIGLSNHAAFSSTPEGCTSDEVKSRATTRLFSMPLNPVMDRRWSDKMKWRWGTSEGYKIVQNNGMTR